MSDTASSPGQVLMPTWPNRPVALVLLAYLIVSYEIGQWAASIGATPFRQYLIAAVLTTPTQIRDHSGSGS